MKSRKLGGGGGGGGGGRDTSTAPFVPPKLNTHTNTCNNHLSS